MSSRRSSKSIKFRPCRGDEHTQSKHRENFCLTAHRLRGFSYCLIASPTGHLQFFNVTCWRTGVAGMLRYMSQPRVMKCIWNYQWWLSDLFVIVESYLHWLLERHGQTTESRQVSQETKFTTTHNQVYSRSVSRCHMTSPTISSRFDHKTWEWPKDKSITVSCNQIIGKEVLHGNNRVLLIFGTFWPQIWQRPTRSKHHGCCFTATCTCTCI